MFNVVLLEPEIPPNTGNIIRLCANSGVSLHLVRPLGFELGDRELKRAGLDYHEYTNVQVHDSLTHARRVLAHARLFAFSTRGTTRHDAVEYRAGDALLFGPETRGLPQSLLDSLPAEQVIRIPLTPDSRSLNLSNAVAIAVYEAWRQTGFAGSEK